jgi:hypothetical protein
MTRRIRIILAVIAVGLTNGVSVRSQDWATANAATVRLKPSVFRSVPISVREYLERRKCVIPQSSFDKTPHNVVRGRFTSATRTDIAVLCSVTDVSSVLVFRGGSTSDVSELATHPDEMFLQVVNPGVVGYSRALAVAGPAYIREHHAAYGGPQPPPLDHDGINDMFIEKASVVWYWYRGEWLQLQGSD